MANEQWKIGDIVNLKSGGPRMTVENCESNTCHCVWFVHTGPTGVTQTLERGVFPSAALKPVRERE
jgi:uncharacterized protein YodC (DUF2158 family)